jgi:hypothetical protein
VVGDALAEVVSRARREALDELTTDAIDMGVYDEAIRRGRQPSGDQSDE